MKAFVKRPSPLSVFGIAALLMMLEGVAFVVARQVRLS